ncbi:MAG: hypothetical protein A3H88_02590 [Candidatus Blackburnbacteria bacterium RIFCSPLOWO2_02_FULL_44_9]|nr:MAG: hypothetical protein A3A62_00790 [Candidatus Blackburnbacteria bacterium RIFCSPLOWO2_01_FULL_44_43]OGY15406.1 MAG: hypothetical protein A3H88_02590 [Candidatus Blackburnbacteria bacterium RIFCSPLOWO2_02_FULL_44_9]
MHESTKDYILIYAYPQKATRATRPPSLSSQLCTRNNSGFADNPARRQEKENPQAKRKKIDKTQPI